MALSLAPPWSSSGGVVRANLTPLRRHLCRTSRRPLMMCCASMRLCLPAGLIITPNGTVVGEVDEPFDFYKTGTNIVGEFNGEFIPTNALSSATYQGQGRGRCSSRS